MKKRKILISMMAIAMALCVNAMPVNASDDTGPLIANPSFEDELDQKENQVYKATRTNEKAYDGDYSIKVGAPRPEDESQVSLWSSSQGKGSVNVMIHNVKPNTKYKVTTHYMKGSEGILVSTGVVDVDGQHSTSPWKLASSIKMSQDSEPLNEWQTHVHEITTGPRTDEMYAFGYTGDYGAGSSGLFYFDDVQIEEISTSEAPSKASIGYKALPFYEFPATIPAIQSFEKKYGTFNLDTDNTIFSTDAFSKDKTTYLAEKMKDKGIIDNYTIKTISNIDDGEGIVVVKQPITFDLPAIVKDSKVDAYQMDITEDKVVVHADYIEGIQNGTMTLLQAFTQRKVIPTGTVKDYTDQVVRGLQVDSGRRYYSIDWLKEQVEQMAYQKQNKLQLRLKDNEGIRYDSTIASFMKDGDRYWTQEEVSDLVNFAAKFNIEVIPEIDYPGHANQDAGQHKDWTIAGSPQVLDISKPEVRDYMISVYKETIDFFDAKTMHIGGDEYIEGGLQKNQAGREHLANWAKEQTGNQKATEYDAIKLFFNQAYDELKEAYPDLNIIVWNDNMKDVGGIVPLNQGFIIDFWAANIYGSLSAQKTVNAGYQTMSSSTSNYHDLWPTQSSGPSDSRLDRPLPKELYEQFTRYNYSNNSTSYKMDEVLTTNLDKSLGQMFPIWDDAHGYIPEYILSRTLFPRYAGFAQKTWGANYSNEMSYAQFENLLFLLGTPSNNLLTQVKVNYTKADLDVVVNEIETALESKVSNANVEALNIVIDDIKANPDNHKKDGFYNAIVKEIIDKYENLEYTLEGTSHVADKTELRKVLDEALTHDLKNFTEETAGPLALAIETAERVMASKEASKDEVDETITLLQAAIDGLVYADANYQKVDEAINYVEELGLENYFEDVSKVNEAIEGVIRNLDASKQNEVDAMATAIMDAITELVGSDIEVIKEKVKLNGYIEEAKWFMEDLELEMYTPESVEAAYQLIQDAEDLMRNKEALMNDLTKSRYDFIDLLYDDGILEIQPADYSKLEELLAYVDELNADDYVDFSAVEEAYWDAYDYLDWSLSIVDQWEVDEYTQALQDALDALQKIVNKEDLNKAIEEAEKLQETKYTEESWQVFTDALTNAKAVIENDTATENDIIAANYDLEQAIKALLYKQADYTKVNEALAKADALIKEHYIDFSEVEKAVNSVVKDLDITKQSKVDAMAKAIEDAISKLTLKQADYTKVNQAIEKANALKKEDYLDFSGVEKAIASVVKDLDITKQSEVDAMAKAIEDAINALEAKPDVKPTPEDKYEIIEGKDTIIKQGETPIFRSNASIETFKEVLLDGKVLDRKHYTVEESVTPDGPVINPEEPTTPSNPETSVNKPTESTTPKTGDDTPIVLWGSMVVLGGLGLMKLKRKED